MSNLPNQIKVYGCGDSTIRVEGHGWEFEHNYTGNHGLFLVFSDGLIIKAHYCEVMGGWLFSLVRVSASAKVASDFIGGEWSALVYSKATFVAFAYDIAFASTSS